MPQPKRIILLLDGTWNDADVGPIDTNVVRIRELLVKSLGVEGSSDPTPEQTGQVLSRDRMETQNFVYYERGVGTGPIRDRLKGGAFGNGLARNIRRAYKFLSFHYQPGDQIFIFGFSRGSYTARSLIGYIAAAGLLKREWCT